MAYGWCTQAAAMARAAAGELRALEYGAVLTIWQASCTHCSTGALLTMAGELQAAILTWQGAAATVVSLGSWSKILGPGLRLGWIDAEGEVLEQLAADGEVDAYLLWLCVYYSLLTTHYSLPHYSPRTTHYALLTTHYSLLTA